MSIDYLFSLTPEQRRAYQIAETDQGRLRIYQHDTYRWLSTRDGAIQAIMRFASPVELVLPNQVAMLMALLINPGPEKLLNLGSGTGAFERFFHARLPDLGVVSVDNDPSMVVIAREHFCIPHDWPVQINTAEEYLAQCEQSFGLMLCDIFAGEQHPRCLFDAAFYQAAAQRLTHAGVLSLNLYPQAEAELVSILLALRESFPWIMLIKIPAHDNIVLLACRQPPPSDTELAQRAANVAHRLKLNFSDLLHQLERLPPPGT